MSLNALGKPEAALNLRDATLAKIPSTEKNKSEVIEVSPLSINLSCSEVVTYVVVIELLVLSISVQVYLFYCIIDLFK